MSSQSRRKFLKFLGRTGLAGSMVFHLKGIESLYSLPNKLPELPFNPIRPSDLDSLILPEGLQYQLLMKAGDAINGKDFFGENNDCLTFTPEEVKNEALVWVNHENFNPFLLDGYREEIEKTQAQVDTEMQLVGGSILHLAKDQQNDGVFFLLESNVNTRLTAKTAIPFAWHEPIAGEKEAIGTLANCGGDTTLWGTVLSCEGNYEMFFGERNFQTGERLKSDYGWEKFYDYPPEHYGWVLETNLMTGKAKKLVAMGRCFHGCVTLVQTKDNCVVYSGDAANEGCLYKFISQDIDSLEKGSLYVANMEKGTWELVDFEKQLILQQNFKSQTEVLIRLREAATLLGGTPLDRPQDIKADPISGHIFISLAGNIPKGNYMGSILKLKEKNNDKASLNFSTEVFLTGGQETGFACPVTMVFDKKGNLWFTSGMAAFLINKSPYKEFKNNGLFYAPMQGIDTGIVFQIASAPCEAEFKGPCFSNNGKTLFLCVQHPGEGSKGLKKHQLTSLWPDNIGNRPRSAVVMITGPALDKLLN